MPPRADSTIESILSSCDDSAPQPWRPAAYAKSHGIHRDSLDEPLNRLRNAGLVKLTDWEPGVGQGYVLTDDGRAALANPQLLERRLNGKPEPGKRRDSSARDTFARGEEIRDAVFEHHPSPVTRTLIALQVVAFAAGLYFALRAKIPLEHFLTTGQSPFLGWLAVSPPHLARGDWWTLLTYALVHAGGLHLMLNLLSTGALGPAVEGMFGRTRYLAIWLISALGGSVLVAARGQAAVGSSGAICGMIAAQAAFIAIYHSHIGKSATSMYRSWLIKTVIIIVLMSSIPGVSGAAHLGGAIAGAIAGALLAVHRFGPAGLRPVMLVGVIAIPLLGITYLTEKHILNLAITTPEVARREMEDFTVRLKPQIDRVESKAQDIDDRLVDPLRSRRPEQRPFDQVKSAIVALSELRTGQTRALEDLMRTGRYQTPNVEQARHAAEDLLRWRVEVSRHYENCLRRAENWSLDREENTLQFLLNQATEAEIAYNRALADG
jgi:membrane associated rhomboid family serine protease